MGHGRRHRWKLDAEGDRELLPVRGYGSSAGLPARLVGDAVRTGRICGRSGAAVRTGEK